MKLPLSSVFYFYVNLKQWKNDFRVLKESNALITIAKYIMIFLFFMMRL